MNKKLGAFALLGASAVVLAGCAGGSGSPRTRREGAEIRSGSSAPTRRRTARDYLKETFEDENHGWTLDIEEKTWDGLVDKLPPPVVATTRPTSSSSATRRRSASRRSGPVRRHHRHLRRPRRRRPAPRLRRGRHVRRRVLRRAASTPVAASSSADPQIVDGRLPETLDDYVAQAKDSQLRTPTQSRASTRRARTGTTPFPTSGRHGGEIAVQDGDEWDAQLLSDESVAGLEQLQEVIPERDQRARRTATRPSRGRPSATARSRSSRLPAG